MCESAGARRKWKLCIHILYTGKPSHRCHNSVHWFYVNDTTPQALVSTYEDGGGYRLGFDEGNDLWWTLGLDNPAGGVSVVIPHETIALGQWHQVTGSYDGSVARIYLDGILRNQVNATGPIRYVDNNSVMIGADAGPADSPATIPPTT